MTATKVRKRAMRLQFIYNISSHTKTKIHLKPIQSQMTH